MGGQKLEQENEFMPKHTILVVDDEAAIREMLSIALDAEDFNVLQASNAQQAHATILDHRSRFGFIGLDDARYLGSRIVASTQAR
jgi:DNA-binding NtrC family response regulator